MHDKFFDGDLVFDRLVDGELSAAERRELLASLDDRPDGWRRCALVFLEAQCWSEDLGQFVRQPVDSTSIDKDAQPVLARVASPSGTTQRGVAWLAVAAALFVAFTFGLMWRDRGVPTANDSAPNPAQLAEVVPPPASPDAGKVDDALTLWVRDRKGQSHPVHVPLVDAGTLDRQLGVQFQTGMPVEVRNQLRNRGFDVQSRRRYAPLWLENGRPMIVPVEDTKIVPVSQNVY